MLSAYSNWGPALAGRIVELASGMSFDDYADRYLLEPLTMARSTFREPIPASLSAIPIGFIFDGERRIEHPFEHYHSIGPAGSLTTTAGDMAQFMLAHLAGGRLGERRILSERSTRRMHERAPGFHPFLDGGTRGFYETWRSGRRTIGHKGASVAFESRLTLLPEEQLGIFVVSNTGTGSGFCDAVVDAVIDRFFPAELPVMTPPQDFCDRAPGYCGSYAVSSRSHTKSEKLFAFTHIVDVRACGDRLVISGLTQQPETEWVEVRGENGLFRRVDGEEMLAFPQGRTVGRRQLLGPDPFNPAESIDFLGSPRCTQIVQLIMPIVFAAAGMAAFLLGSGPTAWLATALALINVLIVAGITKTLDYDQYTLLVGPPWPFTAALGLGLLSALLTIVLAGGATVSWLYVTADPAACGSLSVVAVLALGFTYWLKYWNLIGLNLA